VHICEESTLRTACNLLKPAWPPLDCLARRDIPCLACTSVVLHSILVVQMLQLHARLSSFYNKDSDDDVCACMGCVLRMIWWCSCLHCNDNPTLVADAASSAHLSIGPNHHPNVCNPNMYCTSTQTLSVTQIFTALKDNICGKSVGEALWPCMLPDPSSNSTEATRSRSIGIKPKVAERKGVQGRVAIVQIQLGPNSAVLFCAALAKPCIAAWF
jgi:hypothetical protein